MVGPIFRHEQPVVEVDIYDARGRHNPAQVEVKHVQTIHKALIYVGIGDVGHGRELGEPMIRLEALVSKLADTKGATNLERRRGVVTLKTRVWAAIFLQFCSTSQFHFEGAQKYTLPHPPKSKRLSSRNVPFAAPDGSRKEASEI